jgi:hypothetical protein
MTFEQELEWAFAAWKLDDIRTGSRIRELLLHQTPLPDETPPALPEQTDPQNRS